ncbi:hypothetical protein [Streptomyces sp. NRRL S-920]|uniref:hypothetical protein n=1 Tax=Streptomyces sp. NRRL S-920 TaxID=1463921 RepID=UPI0004C6A1FB|nr:hypothetical protein [Streptomyces sp. NRRL S-920]
MNDYPHRVRLVRGHLTHLARAWRSSCSVMQLITACGHTYALRSIADMSAEGQLCHGCESAVRPGPEGANP